MRSFFFPIVAVAGVAALAGTRTETPPSCTIAPEQALLLLHVEKDTMLPHADVEGEFISASGVRRGPYDSLLAVQGTPMPGARVRLLQMDSSAGNEARLVLRSELEFRLAVAPTGLWDILEMFVPVPSGLDSLMMRRMPEAFTRDNKQPRVPLTLSLDRAGSVRADTTLTTNGKTLRVSLVRVDTISVDRRF